MIDHALDLGSGDLPGGAVRNFHPGTFIAAAWRQRGARLDAGLTMATTLLLRRFRFGFDAGSSSFGQVAVASVVTPSTSRRSRTRCGFERHSEATDVPARSRGRRSSTSRYPPVAPQGAVGAWRALDRLVMRHRRYSGVPGGHFSAG
jgi:hypothetical protein